MIIQGTDKQGNPRQLLVDSEGRIDVGEDSPLEVLKLAAIQALQREIIRLRLGMIATGYCFEVSERDVADAFKSDFKNAFS